MYSFQILNRLRAGMYLVPGGSQRDWRGTDEAKARVVRDDSLGFSALTVKQLWQ